ncbi:MAG TPA: CBS domain-containing protein [Longimicrobiales bacterium]
MLVRDLLQKKPPLLVTIETTEHVGAAARLLIERGVGGLVVVDERGRLAGFVGERDIVDTLYRRPGDVRQLAIAQVMRRPPTCQPDDRVNDVMARMTDERLRHLVVVEGGAPVGVISIGDLVRQRVMELEMETGVLRDYVAARRAV